MLRADKTTFLKITDRYADTAYILYFKAVNDCRHTDRRCIEYGIFFLYYKNYLISLYFTYVVLFFRIFF